MASVVEILRYQLDFANWANERILAAAASLTPEEQSRDFKTADKSILNTLAHCYRAERVWLNRLLNKKVDFKVAGDDTLAALQTNWPLLQSGWHAWAQDLTEDAAAANFQYADLKGNPWSQPVWTIVLHVVNHSTHHRGQAVGFIRTLGHKPPDVDLITFSRQRI